MKRSEARAVDRMGPRTADGSQPMIRGRYLVMGKHVTMLVRTDGSVVFKIGTRALAAGHLAPNGETRIVPAKGWDLSVDARLMLMQAASLVHDVLRGAIVPRKEKP